MSKQAKDLYDALRKMTAGKTDVMPAVVKVVNNDNTVDVEYNSIYMPSCRLQSITGNNNGMLIKPAVGSIVLLKRINEQDDFFVCMFSAVDEYVNTIGNYQYKLNGSGHLIKAGNDTLKDALTLIIQALQNIYVVYGNNPDFAKLSQALTKINNILQ